MDINDLIGAVARQEKELIAQRYWLKKLFAIACADAPGAFAQRVGSLILDVKNFPPQLDGLECSTDDAERVTLVMAEAVEALGRDIIEILQEMAAEQNGQGRIVRP